jgi:hypothetical protein
MSQINKKKKKSVLFALYVVLFVCLVCLFGEIVGVADYFFCFFGILVRN